MEPAAAEKTKELEERWGLCSVPENVCLARTKLWVPSPEPHTTRVWPTHLFILVWGMGRRREDLKFRVVFSSLGN